MARKGSYKETFQPAGNNPGLAITVRYAGNLDEGAVARARPMAAIAAALGLAAKGRNLATGKGAMGEQVGKHFVTGGMWDGMVTRVRQNNKITNTFFGKSKNSKRYKLRTGEVKTYVYKTLVANRIKAWSASRRHTYNVLTNTPEEVEAARSILARAIWDLATQGLEGRGDPPPITGDRHVIRYLRGHFL